jgi:cytochrome bd ubiquinol oxidase subunit II
MMAYEIFWYIIVCAAVIFYVVLDGFDLGVGMVMPCVRSDYDRRVFLNAIGPVWDGNAVWMIVIGGALLAGFTPVYASLFSAFYMPFMILIAAIIFRAVSIEFRSKISHQGWRFFWDWVFSIASYIMAFLVGIVLGNLVDGIKINEYGEYVGTFWDFFSPYTIIVALTGVALFIMHGSIYLLMKTENEVHDRVRRWINPAIVVFIFFYIILTLYTVLYKPHMMHNLQDRPWLFLVAIVAMLAIANIPREVFHGRDGMAFISSSVAIIALFAVFGLGTFPVMLRSSINPELYSLTLYNSGATRLTFFVLTIIACIGVPMICTYSWYVYRIFRGKVVVDEKSSY